MTQLSFQIHGQESGLEHGKPNQEPSNGAISAYVEPSSFEHVKTVALLWTHQDGINKGQSAEQMTQSHQMGLGRSTRCQHVNRARLFAPGCDVPAGCFTSLHKWWDAPGEASASWGNWRVILSSTQPADTDLYRNIIIFNYLNGQQVSATYIYRCG